MATLTLKEFRCVEETDESGWDSPYFVIFHGNVTDADSGELVLVRRPEWDNDIETGSLRQANATIANGVDKQSVVLVGLLEEDVNPDIAGHKFAVLRDNMRYQFRDRVNTGAKDANSLGLSLLSPFSLALYEAVENDEKLDADRLKITTLSGPLKLIHLHGDGGYYRVRFVVN